MRKKITIAQWATNMSHSISSLEDWCEMVEGALRDAALEKADILLMPEYVSEQWMHFAPTGLKPTEEVAWMGQQVPEVLPRLQEMVRETGVALVAGTMPWAHPDKVDAYTNRAWMFFPDRDPVFHDKLVMTPFEKDSESWSLETGDVLRVFEWRGIRMAMLICLDIEMPALSSRLADADVDLLLVPSMTELPSGYNRVFGCAKARAIELMVAVAVVGCVGAAGKPDAGRDGHASGAAVYIPCEKMFGYNGIHSNLPLHDHAEGRGEMLISRDVPVGEIRALRKGKPEVWPGAWNADHVKVQEV